MTVDNALARAEALVADLKQATEDAKEAMRELHSSTKASKQVHREMLNEREAMRAGVREAVARLVDEEASREIHRVMEQFKTEIVASNEKTAALVEERTQRHLEKVLSAHLGKAIDDRIVAILAQSIPRRH